MRTQRRDKFVFVSSTDHAAAKQVVQEAVSMIPKALAIPSLYEFLCKDISFTVSDVGATTPKQVQYYCSCLYEGWESLASISSDYSYLIIGGHPIDLAARMHLTENTEEAYLQATDAQARAVTFLPEWGAPEFITHRLALLPLNSDVGSGADYKRTIAPLGQERLFGHLHTRLQTSEYVKIMNPRLSIAGDEGVAAKLFGLAVASYTHLGT